MKNKTTNRTMSKHCINNLYHIDIIYEPFDDGPSFRLLLRGVSAQGKLFEFTASVPFEYLPYVMPKIRAAWGKRHQAQAEKLNAVSNSLSGG